MGNLNRFQQRLAVHAALKKQSLTLVGLLVALTSGLGVLPQVAHADFVLHHWEDQYEEAGFFRTKLEGLYYTSTSNFDATGSLQTPAGLQSYLRAAGDLTLSAGLGERVSLYGRLNWLSINAQGTSNQAGTGYGFGDQTLGLNFRVFKLEHGLILHRRVTKIDLQIQGDFPAYSNTVSEANRTPNLGDGSIDWTGGIFVTLPFHGENEDGYQLQFGTGYTYRSLGFSSAVPMQFNLAYTPAKDGFTGYLGIAGFFSLKTDPSGITQPARSIAGSASSLITGGSNASLLQVVAKMGYQTSPTSEFLMTGAFNTWGQVAPGGLTLTLGYQKRFGGPDPQPAIQNEAEYGKANRGFVNYSLDAKVVKAQDRLNLLKIDKGNQEGVEVGQIFDIFIIKKDGSVGGAIARGEVTSVKLEESALEITEYYKEVPIDEGFLAKRVAQ